jgi:hypothetical protein
MSESYARWTMEPLETLFAWIAVAPEGTEGLVIVRTANGQFVPAIGGERERVEAWRAQALEMHAGTGCKVQLVAFGRRRVLEEISE